MKTVRAILTNEQVTVAMANHLLALRGFDIEAICGKRVNVDIRWSFKPGDVSARVEVNLPDEAETDYSVD